MREGGAGEGAPAGGGGFGPPAPAVPPAGASAGVRAEKARPTVHGEIARALAAVPEADAWGGLDPLEAERRACILRDIRARIRENGPRHAAPSPDRGRLFMPFAALEGYEGMLDEVEQDVAGPPPAR